MKAVNCLLSILAAVLPYAMPVNAQPMQIAQPPRLQVTTSIDQPIQLQSVRIAGEVGGRYATTDIEMTFYNPNRRVLEGELQFPLLDGQTVAGFAMDVNDVLRDAVPVEKTRGRQVFEDVVRGNIDPGLLEVTQGNNFKLRVYPIPAQGRKRVVLRIAESLISSGPRVLYRVPVGFAELIGALTLDLRVHGTEMPELRRNAVGALPFYREVGPRGTSWRATTTARDFRGQGLIEIAVMLGTATVAQQQRFEGADYFTADLPLNDFELPRKLPARVGLLWDSSGSGATRDHGREFAVLDAYFKRLGNGEVVLTRIRDAAEASATFPIRKGDWSALRQALVDTAYDGATYPGAFVPAPGIGEYLFFSDGLANFGENRFPVRDVPVFTLSAAVASDPAYLAGIAHRTGGRFIDLVAHPAAEAARQLLSMPTRVDILPTEGIEQTVLASPFPQGGRVLVAGVRTEPGATLKVRLTNARGETRAVSVPLAGAASDSMMAAVQWARLRIASLDSERDFHRAEIRRLGQRFRLATAETSLIVLDRVEDYARYEIAPPPELRSEYERLLAARNRTRTAERQSHLDNIARRFEEKWAWWQRDFPKDRPSRADDAKKAAIAARAVGEVNTNVIATPAAPPPSTTTGSAPRALHAERAERERSAAGATDRPAEALRRAAPMLAAPAADAASGQDRLLKVAEPAGAIAPTATISLKRITSAEPYVARLRTAGRDDMYRIYLDEKPAYANSTAFFLDVADLFIERGLPTLAVRILSNLAEMDLENRHILRVLGYRLIQADAPEQAIPVFRKVLALSPGEPQSYRDLGLALAAHRQHQAAVDALYEVVSRPWHNRFPDIELIALAEMNAIIATAPAPIDLSRIDTRLVKNMPLDLRAVLTWDADNTDIDLWVTDPNGEKAYYGNRLTYQGGRMSQDFTGGYGPEEFSLKKAKPGKYKVEAQYYGDRRQNLTGAATLSVKLSTRFGTREQQDRAITLRLKDRNEVVFVGEFEIH